MKYGYTLLFLTAHALLRCLPASWTNRLEHLFDDRHEQG